MKISLSSHLSCKALLGSALACSALFALGCGPERPSMADEIDASPYRMRENPTCEIPGNPSNWLAAYCMWMNNVAQFDQDSDIEDDPVKLCIKDVERHPSVPNSLCERNKYFKQQICETLTMNGVFHGNVAQCVASRGTIPRVVREGL